MSVSARAAVLRERGGAFDVTDIEVGDPRDDEVLVKLVATGLCHTDLGVKFGAIPFPFPGVIGHEGAGVIAGVGSSISDLKRGDKVLLSFTSCGECAACVADHPAYCTAWLSRNIFQGARADGSSPLSSDGRPLGAHFFGQSSFAQYAIADRRSVVKVDPDADLTVLAPLGCGVQTGFGSIWNVLDVQAGQSTAVFGTGAVGLSAIVAASLRGAAPLIAVDVVPERLSLALELGATHTIHAGTENVAARIAEITGTIGLEQAFDTTGDPGVARTALDALGIGGTLGVCGAPPPGTEIAVDIQSILVGKTLTGITMGDSNPAALIPELVRLHAEGRLPLEKLIGTYALEDIEQAADDMHEGRCVKPVIIFGD